MLVADGPTFKSMRRSRESDPVCARRITGFGRELLNALDGTLYVLDMSREVIEAIHIPLDVVKYLNLKRGRNKAAFTASRLRVPDSPGHLG